jgi:hypothetical protein
MMTPMRRAGEWSELSSRLGEFGAATDWGKKTDIDTAAEAARAMRDVTVDFQRQGNIARELNRLSAFFTAQIGGIDKLARVFKEHPVRSTSRALLYVTAPTLALYAMNRKNEDYWNVPHYWRDLFYLIPAGKMANGHTRWLPIPKPFELGLIFGTLPERLLAKYDRQDPHYLDGLMGSAERVALPNIVADALAPVLGAYANTSFTGAPIVPRRELDLPPELQYGPGTSALGRVAGKALGVSPRKIDAMVTGYTAGLGRLGL